MTIHKTDTQCTLQSNFCAVTIHITDVVDQTLKERMNELEQKITHLDDYDHVREKKLLAFPNQEELRKEYYQLELHLADFKAKRYNILQKHLRTFKTEYEEFVQDKYNSFL